MLLRLPKGDPRPLHEQVASAIRRAIAEGECAVGGGLPPARDLAAMLDLNPNTVLRALRQLRDEGLLEFRRGRGIRVVAGPEYGEFTEQVRQIVAEAARLGLSRDELVEMIETA
ncbi:GntR family transcriptional regulator [Actinomadura sp. KC06]|uniref:GntR family transcriptional regulator n=1 Tax=Actinomadura sp. KC06 TaxID=2530369 RepID=UPI00104C1425|nr:GntR family transcriptional regulator [Actinomadura sp. KC06]TDD34855.1 GntR family transcriptional regulator [Actinomadura sp. KC06]